MLKAAHALGQISKGGPRGRHWSDAAAGGEPILAVFERTLAKVNKAQIQRHKDETDQALGVTKQGTNPWVFSLLCHFGFMIP